MKRIFALALALIFITGSAFCQSYSGTKRGPAASGLNQETLIYLALPSPALSPATVDAYITTIKAGGTVTLTSQTLNTSNPTGGPLFFSNPLTDIRWTKGFYITLTQSTNTLKCLVGAAGTGETTTDVLPAFNFTSGWTTSNATINNATTFTPSAANGFMYYTSAPMTPRGLFKGSFTRTAGSCYVANDDATPLWVTGNSNVYKTNSATTGGILLFNGTNGETNTVSALTILKILTPSATGVWFSSPTVTGSFNYNAVYTITVTKS
jgi:hypothetical protein